MTIHQTDLHRSGLAHFEAGDTYLEALVMSPYTETDTEITISTGSRSDSKVWKPQSMPLGFFISLLCKHLEGGKEGPAFVLADMVQGQRLKHAVKALTGVGLDIDNGISAEKIDAALKELGCLAVRYTTHSNFKTLTEFKKDEVIKFIKDNDPSRVLESDETIRWYLLEKKKWDPEHVKTCEYNGTEHTNKGIVVCVKHAPMHKNRIVIPFAHPFDILTASQLQKDAMEKWKKVPLALADKLGVTLDTTGTDPSRLFYFPRHPKGQKGNIALFGGPPFDWRTLNLDGDAFEKGAADLLKGKGGKSKTPEGKKLGRWSIKRAHGFQIVDVLEDNCPDRIRSRSGDKVEIECPNDDAHSNAGSPEDRACMAVNAGSGPSEIFTISCRHESCQGLTNLDMLGMMIKAEWFGEDVLEDERYDAIIDEDDQPRAGLTLEAKVEALSPASTDSEIRALLKELAALSDPLLEDRIIKKMADVTGRGKKHLNGAYKQICAEENVEQAQYKPSAAEKSQLAAIEARFPIPTSAHGEYRYNFFDGRIWLYEKNERLCTPLCFDARVINAEEGNSVATRLKYLRGDGEEGYVYVSSAEAIRSKGAEYLTSLRSAGVSFTEKGESFLVSHCKEIIPTHVVTKYRTSGWKGEMFLTPWGEAINTNQQVELDDAAKPKGRNRAGSLLAWKQAADKAIRSGSIYIQLGLMAGFSGPVLKPAGLPSMVMHFGGLTTNGKTTGKKGGASVWGDPKEKQGLLFTCDATARSYEARHEMGSGCFVGYDETHLIAPDDFHNLIYRIPSGTGTDRLNRDSKLKSVREWSVFAVTSGECTVSDKIRASGRNPGTGVSTRVLEIAVDDAKRLSLEDMAVIEQFEDNFGHAGPVYVRYLAENGYTRGDKLAKRLEHYRTELAGPDPSAAKLRMARIAAVLWGAGELAKEAGLFEADVDIAQIIAGAWKIACGSEIAADSSLERAIETLCTNLLMDKSRVDAGSLQERNFKARKIYKYQDGRAVYMIPNRAMFELSGGSVGSKALAAALNKRGMLLTPSEGYLWPYVKGEGKVPSYLIWADTIEEE